jgi:hypothetical protein
VKEYKQNKTLRKLSSSISLRIYLIKVVAEKQRKAGKTIMAKENILYLNILNCNSIQMLQNKANIGGYLVTPVRAADISVIAMNKISLLILFDSRSMLYTE